MSKLLALFTWLCASNAYVFKPEDTDYKNSYLPTLFNFTESQYDVTVGSTSYWSTSFITGTNMRQYLAVSHILTTEMPSIVCRSSVLDLESLDYWVDLDYCSRKSDPSDRGPLKIEFGSYGFGSTSDDQVSSMYTYAHPNKSFSFELEWNSSSKAVLNAGAGVIGFGDWPANATEWGIPAGRTSGSITLDNTTIEVDPDNSLTWYDRQISYGVPKNWTWFELHFDQSSAKASIWAIAGTDQLHRFATIRDGDSVHVMAFTLDADTDNTWTSPNSNITYPLGWDLKFENGDALRIGSVRPDQEMYGHENLVDSAYEGFITFEGTFQGKKTGFGVVEMVTVS